MTFRPGPLRAAAVLAAGFVGVRVVYRVLFHGAEGSGVVLLPFAEYRLPPPFSHVVLLGPTTVDGIWDAAASAFPIALTILAFGVLNALVDMPRLLARGSRRGPLRGIARTLAIAWATLPALAEAVRRVRLAQRLRGERGGVRVLAPVLERTLERATAIAAALELRGLAGRGLEGDCAHPVVTRGLSLSHRDARGGRDATPLAVCDLDLPTGSVNLVTGPTGSGKSTLLRAIAGLHTHLDGGALDGELRVVGHDRVATPPRDTSRLVGVVLQNPRDGFTAESVADEIGAALDLRGVARTIVGARVDEVCERIGITHLRDRAVTGLSAGEATLVAIAAAVVENPVLLVVDEPLADLDVEFRARIVALLDALAHDAGICVIVAEHRHADLAQIADARLDITDGAVRRALAGVADPTRPADGAPLPRNAPGAIALRADDVTVRHGDRVAVDAASLTLCSGEIVALAGPNGAGKSSLLIAIALPHRGDHAVTTPQPGGVALVPDASDDLFVCTTVGAECARTDRRARLPRGTTATRFATLLSREGQTGEATARFAAQHPRDLSTGERRCLAIALQWARDPAVLLVDEPTRGLDATACALVAAALGHVAADGAAVMVATHDDVLLPLADRMLAMRDGRLVVDPAARRAAVTRAGDEGVAAATEEAARAATTSSTTGATVAATGHAHEPHEAPPSRASTPDDTTSTHTQEPRRHPQRPRGASTLVRLPVAALALANLVALAAFTWPLVAYAVPADSSAAVPAAALALAPVAAIVVLLALDSTVRSAHTLALLGTLAAIGAAVRIVGTGVGGVEAVFILLILAGRAFGARFGFLLGLLTIALSTLVTGSFGPWTPFQMFACAWVGAGAGLLPRRLTRGAEIALLCTYGVIASYLFGLIMNLWFWPFAVGGGAGISYEPGAPIGQNLASFVVYSLVTSSLTWDTLRAVTTVIGITVVGGAVLAALRRAKPVEAASTRHPLRASRRTSSAAPRHDLSV
ncbi:ATP-binding cassette domain-containing protein [Microbacterium sp. C7(2022)]|uniref:ATP-binding cassette domain-containing protein n=1 Tax=Microbacterium sp. C7(2022) TaxID=2992759 RepID=UPI00237B4D03|nr:ATP-binding cassette domain-containing protein [Microbacterium sp. C7(2022)]MDE0546159.1 ATP-binding cassette domain-containing protein [Microbacterium sp. C7(2022)]